VLLNKRHWDKYLKNYGCNVFYKMPLLPAGHKRNTPLKSGRCFKEIIAIIIFIQQIASPILPIKKFDKAVHSIEQTAPRHT
jgi:hypothetical protein